MLLVFLLEIIIPPIGAFEIITIVDLPKFGFAETAISAMIKKMHQLKWKHLSITLPQKKRIGSKTEIN